VRVVAAGCSWTAAIWRCRTSREKFRVIDNGAQKPPGRRAGEEPVQSRWHQRDSSEGRNESIAVATVKGRIGDAESCCAQSGQGPWRPTAFRRRIVRPRDITKLPNSIHETTNCPRKPRNTHLHNSKWQGTSAPELWTWLWALYRAATASSAPRPFRTELDTDSRQLGYAREQSALLSTRVPEARRTEDLGEGVYRIQ
jgi:hypothetical protein